MNTLHLVLIITSSRLPAPFLTPPPQIHTAVIYLKCKPPRHFPLPCSEKRPMLFPITYFPSQPHTAQPLCLISPHFPSPSSGSSNTISCCLWSPPQPRFHTFVYVVLLPVRLVAFFPGSLSSRKPSLNPRWEAYPSSMFW